MALKGLTTTIEVNTGDAEDKIEKLIKSLENLTVATERQQAKQVSSTEASAKKLATIQEKQQAKAVAEAEKEAKKLATIQEKQQAKAVAEAEKEAARLDKLRDQQQHKLRTFWQSLSSKGTSGGGAGSTGGGGIIGGLMSFKNAMATVRSNLLLFSFGIGGAVASIGTLLSNMIKVTAEFEKYNTILRTTYGNQAQSNLAMERLVNFAAETPYSLSELTNSFIKLVNRGIEPTTKELQQIGDLASSLGKPFDQLVEAILDAQTGEFERLKEFGVKTKTNGDLLQFTFKGVTTEVANTSQAITDYIIALGKTQGVQGAMIDQMDTIAGKTSNLADAWDRLANSPGLGKFWKAMIGATTTIIETVTPSTQTIDEEIARLEKDIEDNRSLVEQTGHSLFVKAVADSEKKLALLREELEIRKKTLATESAILEIKEQSKAITKELPEPKTEAEKDNALYQEALRKGVLEEIKIEEAKQTELTRLTAEHGEKRAKILYNAIENKRKLAEREAEESRREAERLAEEMRKLAEKQEQDDWDAMRKRNKLIEETNNFNKFMWDNGYDKELTALNNQETEKQRLIALFGEANYQIWKNFEDKKTADAEAKSTQDKLRELALFNYRVQLAQDSANILTSLASIFGKGQKAAALVEIAVNAAIGVARAVSAGAPLPFPANLGAIASGVSAVLAGISSAKKLLSGGSASSSSAGAGSRVGTSSAGAETEIGLSSMGRASATESLLASIDARLKLIDATVVNFRMLGVAIQ